MGIKLCFAALIDDNILASTTVVVIFIAVADVATVFVAFLCLFEIIIRVAQNRDLLGNQFPFFKNNGNIVLQCRKIRYSIVKKYPYDPRL